MKIFDGKKNFRSKNFLYTSNKWLKIMFCLMSAVELVGVKIWWVHMKASEMRIWKLVLGLSLGQILPEKINNMIRVLCPGRFSLVESVCIYYPDLPIKLSHRAVSILAVQFILCRILEKNTVQFNSTDLQRLNVARIIDQFKSKRFLKKRNFMGYKCLYQGVFKISH